MVDQPDAEQPIVQQTNQSPFYLEVLDGLLALHRQKSAVYGASWRKHGEMLSILPNILRKTDRLEAILQQGKEPTADETLTDTVSDLAVYSMLYWGWLLERHPFHPHQYADEQEMLASMASRLLRYGGWGLDSTLEECQDSWSSAIGQLESLLLSPVSSGGGDTLREQTGPYFRRLGLATQMAAAAVGWLSLTKQKQQGGI